MSTDKSNSGKSPSNKKKVPATESISNDNVAFGEGRYVKLTVRNAMPPPPNPHRKRDEGDKGGK